MPPRHAYWTIILDGKPTAFRAHTRDELAPTLRQLQARHPDAVMMWFARGRLWESQEQEREAHARRRPAEKRGPGWRPGGSHRDPRDRFKIPRDEKRRRFAARARRDRLEPRTAPPREGEAPRGPRREGERPRGPRPDRRREAERRPWPRPDQPPEGERPRWPRPDRRRDGDRPREPRPDRPREGDQPRGPQPDRRRDGDNRFGRRPGNKGFAPGGRGKPGRGGGRGGGGRGGSGGGRGGGGGRPR